MVKATVTVKDKKSKTVFSKTWETKDIGIAADKFSKMYPDCWVKVEVNDLNWVSRQPANMSIDAALVESGKMSLTKFTSKWYGKQPKKESIEQELIDEFGEDELV